MKNNEKIKKFIKFGLCAVILLATVMGTVLVGVHNHEEEVNALSVSKTVSGTSATVTVTGSISCTGSGSFTVTATHSGYPKADVRVWVVGSNGATATLKDTGYVTYKNWTGTTYPTCNLGTISSATVYVQLSVQNSWESGSSTTSRYNTYCAEGSEGISISHNSSGNTSATCTSGGRVYCTNCGYTHSTSGALGHSYGDWYIESGYYKRKCSRCGNVETGDRANYTISFDDNTSDSVTGLPDSMTATCGANTTLPSNTLIRTGYDFLGWSTSSTATSASYTAGGTYNGSSDVTLYAVWELSKYDVTLDANGGLVPEQLEVENLVTDSNFESESVFSSTSDSYFGSRSLKLSGTSVAEIPLRIQPIVGHKYYARQYYKSNGNVGAADCRFELYAGDGAGLNWVFGYNNDATTEWSMVSGICSTDVLNGSNYRIRTFVVNASGTVWVDGVMLIDLTDTFGAGNEPTVEWCDENIPYTERVSFLNSTSLVPTTHIKVTYNEPYGELPTPIREGYTFIGWFYDGTEITSDTIANIVLEDHTLVAMWTRNYYNVTYHAVGGEFEDGTDELTTQVLYGEYIDLSYIPVKDGRAFIGWSLDEEDVSCVMSMQMPATSVDLYAVYSIPVSNISHVVLRSYDLYGNLNEFEMIAIEETLNGYYYWIEDVNLLDGLTYDANNLTSSVAVDILVYDNAGNYTRVPVLLKVLSAGGDLTPPIETTPDPILPEVAYIVAVKHYIWNVKTETWDFVTDRVTSVTEGNTFKPSFLSESDEGYPKGFIPEKIEPSEEFAVTENTIVNAYYMPVPLKVYFDPNGGSCGLDYKELYRHQYYGELPSANRKGYDFLGWYTESVDGNIVKDSDEFDSETDITLYAHWKKHTHTVMYDYMTNGGTSVDDEYIVTEYGEPVNLDNQAYKNDWVFVGWNTDPNATKGLEDLTMGDEDVVLYAIYKKEITATYIDKNNSGIQTRTETIIIYNTAQYAEFIIPVQNTMTGWDCLGWSESKKASNDVGYSSETTIALIKDLTLYGLYVQDITLSYDMNGSKEVRESETKERFYNASDVYSNPTFTIATEPALEGYSFVEWVEYNADDEVVTAYEADEVVELLKDTKLTATWDKIPEISAYDRYFTLADAQNGNITEEALLEKVLGTDLEDGVLVNGTDVIVKGYQAEDFTSFTSDGSVSVTYEATDSFGNSVTKTVTVYIIDTTSVESNKKEYIRFISKDFYLNEDGTYVSKDKGGLDASSLWVTNEDYANVLTQALTNTKVSVDKSEFNFLGTSYEVVQPGSGDWKSGVLTYKFTKPQIEEAKEHISDNGYGKYSSPTGIADFIQKFVDCITIW